MTDRKRDRVAAPTANRSGMILTQLPRKERSIQGYLKRFRKDIEAVARGRLRIAGDLPLRVNSLINRIVSSERLRQRAERIAAATENPQQSLDVERVAEEAAQRRDAGVEKLFRYIADCLSGVQTCQGGIPAHNQAETKPMSDDALQDFYDEERQKRKIRLGISDDDAGANAQEGTPPFESSPDKEVAGGAPPFDPLEDRQDQTEEATESTESD